MTKDIQAKRSTPYAVKATGQMAVKDVDLSKRIVTGFYNTANYYDTDNDVILPGMFNKSIQERGPKSNSVQKIKHLKDHDWGLLPGKIQTLEEKTIGGVTGTYFETKMAGTQLGNDTLINYQEGIYDNHSVGFQYMTGKYLDDSDPDFDKVCQTLINPQDAKDAGFAFVWSEGKMFEGTTCAFGANALTPFLGVKSLNKKLLQMKLAEKMDQLLSQLRNGTQSDDMMQSFEMQILQLKQLSHELFSLPPSEKDTLDQGRHAKAANDEGLNISKILTVFK